MQIIEKKIDELIPYERNPRINDHAVKYVLKSIKEFGFKIPIVIDKNNVIVCGHTRLKAAKKLKMDTVPCIIADDLTEEQIKAFRLADNKVSELAMWDKNLLEIELGDLLESFSMEDFGFSLAEVGKAIGGRQEVEEDDFNSAAASEEKTDIKYGDIFQLGNHRLMCGDSTKEEDVKMLMNGEKAKMMFTSPPYSDMREYEGNKDLSVGNLIQFIRVYKPYADVQCVNLGLQFKNKEVFPYWNAYIDLAHDCGMKLLAWNVWNKTTAGSIGMQKHMFPVIHEWIFCFGEDEAEINKTWAKKEGSIIKGAKTKNRRQSDGSMKSSSNGDASSKFKSMESVIEIYPETGAIRSEHPATFPVKLPAEYIQSLTNENDGVIEPFCGSGTTLIACEELNRKCYAMELEPKYVNVIIKRWEEWTGEKAKKL